MPWGLPISQEELEAEGRRVKSLLAIEKDRGSVLYERFKQDYYNRMSPSRTPPSTEAPELPKPESSDMMNRVRGAYAEGLTLRAFERGLGISMEGPPSAVQATKAEGKPSISGQFLQAWANLAERNPEKAKALLDGLSDEQLAKITYLDSGKEGVNPMLLNSLGNPKSSISDIVAVVDMLPKAPTFQEQMTATMQLAEKFAEKKQPPGDDQTNPMLVMMKDQNDAIREQASELAKANDLLQQQLHKNELDQKDREIQATREEVKATRAEVTELRKSIPTAEQFAEAIDRREKDHEDWAKKRGYQKTDRKKEDEDWERLQDIGDMALTHFGPLIGAVAKRIEGGIGEGGTTKKFPCDCGADIPVPWPMPVGYVPTCPKCGSTYKLKGSQAPSA